MLTRAAMVVIVVIRMFFVLAVGGTEALTQKEAEVEAVNLRVAHYLGLEALPDWENVS